MGRKIEIAGGSCSIGSISFCSDRFKSTAELKGDKVVTTINDLGRAGKFSRQGNEWPLPETVKLLIRVVLSLSLKDVAYIGIFNLVIRLSAWWTEDKYSGVALGLWQVLSGVFVLICVNAWVFRHVLGKWHAAEHMTANAYQQYGSARLNDIVKGSPIHADCGGRMFIPLVLIIITSTLISSYWKINAWLPLLVLLEVFLQAEKRGKLSQRGLFGCSSRVLQKYITTRKPDFNELRVAKAALDGLIEKHNAIR